ncbi:MAG: hypothetical protein GY787_12935 [Alteromonadales bacterium]|nr:hypothetical protein [Alteromonadales bacterium]
MSNLRNNDFLAEVARGNIAGHSIMSAMGERLAVQITANGEDIWRGNDLTPAPTSHTVIPTPSAAGEQMTIVSESVEDKDTTGTGVWTIKIHYLDASGDEQTEDITMNGTTEVDTVATDIRFVQDMYSTYVNGTGVAGGHIKIYKKGSSGLVYNMIAAGGNKSLVPHRMVPTGKTLILKQWRAEEMRDKRVVCRIRSTDMYGTLIAGVFCFKDNTALRKTTSGDISLNIAIPALSIVKVSAWADQADSEAACSWWGVLIDN